MTTTVAPPGLDGAQRTQLERLVIRARTVLEDDLGAQLEGSFGIHADGTIEDEQALRDDASDRATRRDLVEILKHLRAQGETEAGAVARLLREAAFTHLNRLLAIRIAEGIGLLPESLANARQSRGPKDVGEIMPMLGDDYWAYLQLCGDELAPDAPALFDPRNPLLALAPSTVALDELVSLLADPETAGAWLAPDTLGWAYQFFNSGEERRQMREEASAPRNSRELAVRNQFFTPQYVVDFLVQNTLGRRLVEDDPKSALLDEMPLLIDPPTERGAPFDLDDAAILDPACGSGHFLLGCYDLLERAWEVRGVPPSESAPAIVAAMWGVDIDSRCAQVASAAIVLRARRHCGEVPLPRPNIVTARSLPGGSASLPSELGLSVDQQRLVDRMSEVLADAPVLGPLLKAEEVLEQEIRHATFGGAAETLQLTDEAFTRTEADLIAHLQALADQASSSVAERLLAAEADDALRLIEVMRRRYDVILMNPPFGSPVPSSAAYLKSAYANSPAELYACFVSRGLELIRPTGLVGALTNRTGFFLSSLEPWRSSLIDRGVTCFADLGSFVLEGALVEVAAYVIGRPLRASTFIRCLTVRDKSAALASRPDRLTFAIDTSKFRDVPQKCFAYWVGNQFLELFARCEPFQSDERLVSRGLSAGDNFRFIRARWEIAAREVAAGRWVCVSKGGEYSPFYDDVHLLLYWEHEDRPYRDVEGARIFNLSLQGRPGIYWPKRTTSLPSARPLPAGTYFEANSIPAFAPDIELVLGWSNTRLFALFFLMQVGAGDAARGSAAKDWITGPARRLPWVTPLEEEHRRLRNVAREAALAARDLVRDSETTALFAVPELLRVQGAAPSSTFESLVRTAVDAREDRETKIIEAKFALDLGWSAAYGLDDEALRTLDAELEPSPASYPSNVGVSEELFKRAYLTKASLESEGTPPGEALIDSRVESRGRAQVGLRSLEDVCHIFSISPRAAAEKRRELGLLRKEDSYRAAQDLVSYLLGVAMGRWDVRIGRDPSLAPSPPDLFDPVPLCPPGMLVGPDGFPPVDAPHGYPLNLPPGRLLIDEAGHLWDVEAAVHRAAAALFDDSDDILADMLSTLGRRTLRDHSRRQFFKDHLSRYSKSRRRAPIYWPLTVPSRNWGVWLYVPTLSREMLYAVASEAARRERLAVEAIAHLQREQQEAAAGRSARKVADELDSEEKLAEELRRFRTEAERIAGLGWEPDLDDGIVLCAAPMADLFPAWPDARKARDELRKGHYDWATVSRWAAQL